MRHRVSIILFSLLITACSGDEEASPAEQVAAFDPEVYDFKCADSILGTEVTDQIFPEICAEQCRPPTADELRQIEPCRHDAMAEQSSTAEQLSDAEQTPAKVESKPTSGVDTIFNLDNYYGACVAKALGVDVASQIRVGDHSPTPSELTTISDCLMEAGTTEFVQVSEAQTEFDPEAYDIECLDRVLGIEATTAIVDVHRAPTDAELEQMELCLLTATEFVEVADAPATFNPDAYDRECADSVLGMEATDQLFPELCADSCRAPTTDELQQLERCRVGMTGTTPTTSPTALPPGVLKASLQNITLPEADHLPPDSMQCETLESEQCAELRWKPVDGLVTGALTTLRVAPTSPNVIYAGFDANDVSLWKSEDAGNTWQRAHMSAHTSDVAISPASPSVVLYSELEEGIFMSKDSGINWQVTTGSNQQDWVRTSGLYFKALAFSSDIPDLAYGVASHDRGQSFDKAEVFRSEMSGLSWSHVGTCPDCGSVYTVVVQPGDPDTLWVGGDGGVQVSHDAGITWSGNLLTGLSKYEAATHDLALHPSDPLTLLAATSDAGLYRSTDGGQSWSPSNDGIESIQTHQVVFAPSDPNIAYLTTHDGIYRSDDNGKTWARHDNGLTYTFTNAIAVDPTNADVAYVGTAVEINTAHFNHMNEGMREGGGLYKTTDGGNSWHRIDADIEEPNIVAMATHPYLPFNLWAAGKAGRGAFFTPDAGNTWINSTWSGAHYPMVFAFSRTFPAKHFLSSSVRGEEITTSVDGGKSWYSLASGLNTAVIQSAEVSKLVIEGRQFHVHLHGFAVAPSNPDIMYTGTIYDPTIFEEYSMMGAVIFSSRDSGKTWSEASNGFPIETPTSLNAFVIHPIEPDIAYAMTSSYESNIGIGIYKTIDGGESWKEINNGLNPETNDLQIDHVEPDTLYAATDSGVYKTVDGGNVWMVASTGLPSDVVYDLALDPINTLQLYAITDRGVYKTKNGGEHWYPVNLGLPAIAPAFIDGDPGSSRFDRVLEVDATGRVLYAAVNTSTGSGGRLELYRAVMEPLIILGYEFELDSETLLVESTSHVYEVLWDKNVLELQFTTAGPAGTTGRTTVTVPNKFLSAPFRVFVDGSEVPSTNKSGSVSFEHAHNGRSAVIISEQ